VRLRRVRAKALWTRGVVLLVVVCGPVSAIAQTRSGTEQTLIAEGVQMLRSGQTEGAKKSFDAAISVAPHSATALTWRGICENQVGQFSAAAKDLRAAILIDKSALSAHYNLALSLIRLRERDAAIREFERVITMQPEAVPARYNLAVLLEEKGEFAQAIDQLAQAHALAAEDSGVTLHLLADHLKLRDGFNTEVLTADLAHDSASPEIQQQAGAALLGAGKSAEAVAMLKQAKDRAPSAPGINLLLARAYLADEKNAAAITLLESKAPAEMDEETVYLLGLAYAGLGDVARATQQFEVAARMKASDGRPLFHLGLMAERMPGGQVEALALMRDALRLDDANPQYSLALARLLLVSDDAAGAKTVLLKMPAAAKAGFERSTLLGVSLAATNDIVKAISELERAVAADPQLALAHNVLGFCFFHQGEYVRAAAEYRQAADLEPQRLLYLRDAALAYHRAAQDGAALAYAERANALGDATAGDAALLGKLYAAAGRRDEAIHMLRRAVELNSDLDSPYYLLARTYQQMGDRVQAAEWSGKLTALKQRYEAAFVAAKRSQPAIARSSSLLQGGALAAEDTGTE